MECKDCHNEKNQQTACYDCNEYSHFKTIEDTENPPPFGLLERFVRWLKNDFEMTMYRWRPLGDCKGRGCYVMTPGRKNGVPYCLACKEENNLIAT